MLVRNIKQKILDEEEQAVRDRANKEAEDVLEKGRKEAEGTIEAIVIEILSYEY